MTFADQTVGGFLENVASGSVTPGGGAVAAVGGGAGAALCEMVCANTIGNDDAADDDVESTLAVVRDELAARRERLLSLADDDSAAIEELMAAYRTPAGEGRAGAIEAASKRATEVPLETAEACLGVLERAEVVTEAGNPNAVADGAVGAFLALAALRASVFTVRVNLPAIEDEAFVREMEERSSALERAGDEAFQRVRANVNIYDGG